MRLQLLGDARDAFKWDCLHWLLAGSATLHRLLVVPMRCEDEPQSKEGQVPPSRFRARPEIAAFLTTLREEPRSFLRIRELGRLQGLKTFEVEVYRPDKLLGHGWARPEYWQDVLHNPPPAALVFLDPDTGLEPAGASGAKHLRFSEAVDLWRALDDHCVLAIYHHRGQGQTWAQVLAQLWRGMPSGMDARAIFGGDVALFLLGSPVTMQPLNQAVQEYLAIHPELRTSVDGTPNSGLKQTQISIRSNSGLVS